MTSILVETLPDEWVIECFRAELAALPEIVEHDRRPRPRRWLSAHALDSHQHLPPVEVTTRVIRRLPEPDWHPQASCYQVGFENFFGTDNPVKQPSLTHDNLRVAKSMCSACPVRRRCFVASMEQRESHGIWAGVSGRKRRRVFEILDEMPRTAQAEAIERLADEWLR